MNWLIDAVQQGPFLTDGAMGTMLMRVGLKAGECSEVWNVEQPDSIGDVLRGYADAGARLVKTATFGASPLNLARHGLEERAVELNAAAVFVARYAVGDKVFVMGDVGPFGGFLEPYGDTSPASLVESLRVQIGALHEAGADGICIETMVDPAEVELAVRVAREFGDWPVTATYAFQVQSGEFRTLMGTKVAQALDAAYRAGADVAGANCGTNLSLDDYLRLARELAAASRGRPIQLQPNAGAPSEVGGYTEYPAAPADMAAWAVKAATVGVGVLGGCCGTTPEHVRAMGEALAKRS